MVGKLQISLDCVGTTQEVEQIAAEAAVAFGGLSYEVIKDSKAPWPTIVATSTNYGELVGFGSAVYTNEGVEDFEYLISTI